MTQELLSGFQRSVDFYAMSSMSNLQCTQLFSSTMLLRLLLSCHHTGPSYCKVSQRNPYVAAIANIQCTSIACRFLMPSLQPYGGRGWTTACLLPPSCISLYANVLLKLESAQRGISRETLHLSVNSQSPFSAATVFQMLLLDIVLYAVLTWYLDQVRIYPICPLH